MLPIGSRETTAEQVPHPARLRYAGIRDGVSWKGIVWQNGKQRGGGITSLCNLRPIV